MSRGTHHTHMWRVLLYPFAFLLSWYFWVIGHFSYLILCCNDDSEFWVDLWFPSYQSNMLYSSDIQDWVGGHGFLWPWGEPIDPVDL